jgi:1,4-alpha-glucan branching enzyme
MEELANRFPDADGDLRRALNQMARELMLMQSSDWAFIMTTGTTVPYAVKRFREHADRFRQIGEQIDGNRLDPAFIGKMESIDGIFPRADYHDYRP